MTQCRTRRSGPNAFQRLIAAVVANDEQRIEDEATRVVRSTLAGLAANATEAHRAQTESSLQMTQLLNPTSDELTYGGVRYAKDETGAFNLPENIAATVLQHPGGFYRADAEPAAPDAVARTVDFLAPAPFASFDIGAVGFRGYVAEADCIVYGVAVEHCVKMLASGCIPLLPAGWVDPRPGA